MSDADSGFREWRFYVQDMIGFCRRVLRYTAGLDQASFLADSRTYDATLRNLELIGEAATHVRARCARHIRTSPGARL